LLTCLAATVFLLAPGAQTGRSQGAAPFALASCKDFAFSTEEDFLTQGPVPADGNPIISDGDLLSRAGAVCARNAELLAIWKLSTDLGLDAVDVVDVERRLVAFSTELDDPGQQFRSGDLLATNGMVIPNTVLLRKFQVSHDLGLDGLQLIGAFQDIVAFLDAAGKIPRAEWLRNPNQLFTLLDLHRVDIWISTEATQLTAAVMSILDGDLLSVGTGAIVIHQADLLPPVVPAGLPARGVDFGLDAVATRRTGEILTVLPTARFSTEILFRGEPRFTDGDILKQGNGIELTNGALVAPFEPKARFLGLDALHINLDPPPTLTEFLPAILQANR
jgi:hypothetical protein